MSVTATSTQRPDSFIDNSKEKFITIAVIIPCYNVRGHISKVIDDIVDAVDAIYVVDDHCPEKTGEYVRKHYAHPKIKVLEHTANQGVGGATLTCYLAATEDGHSILVKMDGDGQMEPSQLPALIAPIQRGEADYTKGNRFFNLDYLQTMPTLRLFGNSLLSFVNKISSGYWNIMDPTNGYTALHAKLIPLLPLKKINHRYFFESDMLFRLGTLRAVVRDVPMPACYGDEISNLKVPRVALVFPYKYLVRFLKRIWYLYFLRDLNAGSIELVLGLVMIMSGLWFGSSEWISAAAAGREASSGTVMLAALPIIIGFQLLLSSIIYDVTSVPRDPLHPLLPEWRKKPDISGSPNF